MIDTYPNPWDFQNADSILTSTNKITKIVYYDLNEIAMGAPLAGRCSLALSDQTNFHVHNWCGGPPVWQAKGNFVAIPIWTRSISNGTIQQIGIVDVDTKKLRIFAKTFRVLNLRSFEENIISGIDSPIHLPQNVIFDITKEEVASVTSLIPR